MLRQMQPVSAALDRPLLHELIDRGAPSRIGEVRHGHAPKARAIEPRFVRLLRVKCPQRIQRTLAQCAPMRFEHCEAFARRHRSIRTPLGIAIRSGRAPAQTRQLAHLDALRRVAQQG